jgi:hypothetical protein
MNKLAAFDLMKSDQAAIGLMENKQVLINWSLRATHPAARPPIGEEHRHPGAGRDPDSTSVGFVLWIPACAGMTNRSKAEGLSSSRGAAATWQSLAIYLYVKRLPRYARNDQLIRDFLKKLP